MNFASMGLHSLSPFNWQEKRLLTDKELADIKRKQLNQRRYKEKMRLNALRVNPETSVGYSTTITNSEKAPR